MNSRREQIESAAGAAVTLSLEAKREAELRLVEDCDWTEAFLAGENRVLGMIARGAPLAPILEALCRFGEEMSGEVLVSILLVSADGKRLRHGAAPSLPKGYTEAIDGGLIGPCSGSCGTAAYRKEAVIVSDIATDPLWAKYRGLALEHGLRACWSTPIFSTSREVMGTFALYSREPGQPTPQQRNVIEQMTHLAAVAIERKRADEKLRQSEAYLAEAQRLSLTGSFGWRVASGELVWSAETFCILGYDRSVTPTLELVSKRVHPDDLALVRQTLDRATREGTGLNFEHRLLMPDGSIKHVHVVGRPSRAETGEVEYVGAVMDITGRKQAAEALHASEQLARGQVEALTRTLDALAMESDPDRLPEHVLRTITEQLSAHSSSVWRRDESGERMIFEFSFENGRLVTKSDTAIGAVNPSLPIKDIWPWSEVFRTGKPSVLEDIRQGPAFPWRNHLLAQGVITILVVPMLVAGQAAGVIGIRFTRQRAFRAEEMDLAQALANQAMLAIQLTRLSAQSRQSAVMAERNRMARDIHDTLAQGLTGVILQLEAVEEATSQRLADKVGEHLTRAGQLAREGLREARRSVRALRPQSLEEKNLCEALRDLIQKQTAGTPVRANFIVQGKPRELRPEWEENLLRIGQEVLTNVLRHAHASQFDAQLVFDDGELHLNLRDNGSGFDLRARHDGFGLQGMKERVEGMGGQLTIQSTKGEGTAVSIVLPVPNAFRLAA